MGGIVAHLCCITREIFLGEYGKKLGDLSGGHPGGSVVSSQDVVIPF
jgi:hypothetical protein